MKSLKQYLIEGQKVFNYRIKTLVKIEQKHRDILEKVLEKYDPVEFIENKTVFQKSPMDFATIVEAGEVYIIDVGLKLPVSAYLLRQEIRNAWGVQEDFVLVRAENDPMEVYDQQLDLGKQIDAEAAKKGYKVSAKLGVTGAYPEYEQTPDTKNYYGNEYNSKFLELLAQMAADRKENRVEASSPLFSYLNYPKVGTERMSFNKDIPGAPKPVSKWTIKHKKMEKPENIGYNGNFDNEPVEVKKEFVDKKGKKKVIAKKAKSVRKVKI